MKIVIDISEERLNTLKAGYVQHGSIAEKMIVDAVRNGTPLPKGHGDLKDMGNLKYVFDLTRTDCIYSGEDIRRAIESMSIIIPADKDEQEG